MHILQHGIKPILRRRLPFYRFDNLLVVHMVLLAQCANPVALEHFARIRRVHNGVPEDCQVSPSGHHDTVPSWMALYKVSHIIHLVVVSDPDTVSRVVALGNFGSTVLPHFLRHAFVTLLLPLLCRQHETLILMERREALEERL